MICPNCEKTIKDGIAQCPHCGCHFPVKENKEVSNKQKETFVVPPAVESNPIKEKKQEEATPIVPPVVESMPIIEEKQEVVVQDAQEAEVEFVKDNVPQETETKFCKNCGKKINVVANFCKYCGKTV